MIKLIAGLFSLACNGAVVGMAVLAGLIHIFGQDLPKHDELVDYQPKMLSRVYSGEGQVIAEFAHERRIFAPIDEIPDLVKHAFISAEDKNFYDHPGVDAVGIAKAIVRFAQARATGRDARLSGASTISQQVMKNFLVGNARSFERKIKEGILAVRLDGALSKDHILELYLNEIFLGARSYGVMSASQNYFGKPMEELTPAEAAYLAALPKAPSTYHPIRQKARATARRNYVLEEMAQNGYLTRDEAEAAKAQPLETLIGKSAPAELADVEPNYFTAEVRRQLISEVGRDDVYEGGLTVRATIDPELQAEAARALRHGLEQFDRQRGVYQGPVAKIEGFDISKWREQLDATRAPRDIDDWSLAVVMETEGRKAYLGIEGVDAAPVELNLGSEKWLRSVANSETGRNGRIGDASDLWQPGDIIFVKKENDRWTLRQIPEVQGAFMAMDPHSGRVLAIQGGFSYEESVFNRATQALRQPGSSFKPFVYAAALDVGYSPATIVLDAPIVVRAGGQEWRPKNSSGKFYGPTPLRMGLVLSRNLMTVRIAQQIGMDRIADYAERFGVYDNMPHHLSYALGAGETTLYNMVAAYGMFANGGKRVRPTVVDRIQDRHGKTIYRHDPRQCDGCSSKLLGNAPEPVLFDTRSQIMSPLTAQQLISMMEGVVSQGTASRTVGGLGFPVAGKTGTTNDSRDAWFIGFSPNLVAGCYIGYDQPRPMGRGAYGGTLCGPVFKEFMAKAMETRNPGKFKGPANLGLIAVKIDGDTGERLPDYAEGPNVTTEYFTAGTEPPLYASFEIASDSELFGTSDIQDLPFAEEEDQNYFQQEEPIAVGGGTPDSSGGRPRPTPPSDNVGLGTGGLY